MMNDQYRIEVNSLTLTTFLVYIILYFVLIVLNFYFFEKIWLNEPLQLKSNTLENSLRYFTSLSKIKDFTFQALQPFHTHSLISVLGFQSFTYLAFLKKLFQTLLILSLVQISLWIPFYFIYGEKDDSIINISIQHTGLLTCNLILFVLTLLYSMSMLRKVLKHQFRFNLIKSKSNFELYNKWLQLRTVHLIFGQSQKATQQSLFELIRSQIPSNLNLDIIEFNQIRGDPSILGLQRDLQIYRLYKSFDQNQMPCIFKSVPFLQSNPQHFNQKIQKLSQEIQKKSTEQSSTQAFFMVLASIQTANFIVDITKTSLFKQNLTFVCRWAQNPLQLIRQNLLILPKNQQIRDLILNMLALVLLVVVTSPFKIAQSLGFQQNSGIMLPLIIPVANWLIIGLLFIFLSQKIYLTRYQQEKAEMIWLGVYGSIVLIGVPVLKGLYSIIGIIGGPYTFLKLIANLLQISDPFATQLLLVSNIVGNFIQILRLSELYLSYFSPQLCLAMRNKLLIQQNFAFGYSYAQILSNLTLLVLYGPKYPLLTLSGAFYFYSRFYCDGFILLWIRKIQSDTMCKLITDVICWVTYLCTIVVFIYANCFIAESQYVNGSILYGLGGFTLYIGRTFGMGVFKEIDFMGDHDQVQINNRLRQEWKNQY